MKWTYNYYYTLEEVCRPGANEPFGPINHTKTRSPNLYDVGETFYDVNGMGTPSWLSKTGTEFEYINELWQRIRHLFNKDGVYFFVYDKDLDVTVQDELDELHSAASNKALDLLETIYETKDQYIELIKKQKDLETTLLNQLTSTTETWFNDTPQTSGQYVDDTHNTTYNKVQQSVELGNVADKLDIVRRAMNDYYDNWIEHFKKFIIFD